MDNIKKGTLLDTNVDIQPSGVFFNVTNDTIENFVEQYLARQNINGVTAVKVQVRDEGKSHPYVAIYMFMNQNSSGIVSDINSIPPMLRNKVDKYNIRLSDDFKKILYPICGNEIESGKTDGKEYFVKLNIFRVVGLMLAADPNKHSIVITDAQRLPKGNSVISIMKSERFNYGTNNDGDKYDRQINYLERKH